MPYLPKYTCVRDIGVEFDKKQKKSKTMPSTDNLRDKYDRGNNLGVVYSVSRPMRVVLGGAWHLPGDHTSTESEGGTCAVPAQYFSKVNQAKGKYMQSQHQYV